MIDAELMGKNFPYSVCQFVHLAEHLVIRNNIGRLASVKQLASKLFPFVTTLLALMSPRRAKLATRFLR